MHRHYPKQVIERLAFDLGVGVLQKHYPNRDIKLETRPCCVEIDLINPSSRGRESSNGWVGLGSKIL